MGIYEPYTLIIVLGLSMACSFAVDPRADRLGHWFIPKRDQSSDLSKGECQKPIASGQDGIPYLPQDLALAVASAKLVLTKWMKL